LGGKYFPSSFCLPIIPLATVLSLYCM
jgi:hypothetical protein